MSALTAAISDGRLPLYPSFLVIPLSISSPRLASAGTIFVTAVPVLSVVVFSTPPKTVLCSASWRYLAPASIGFLTVSANLWTILPTGSLNLLMQLSLLTLLLLF